MPARKRTKPSGEKHSVEGHSVEIRKRNDTEELWIDGTRRRFFLTQDGYTLHADAYERPQKTLLQSVMNYLRKEPKTEHKH